MIDSSKNQNGRHKSHILLFFNTFIKLFFFTEADANYEFKRNNRFGEAIWCPQHEIRHWVLKICAFLSKMVNSKWPSLFCDNIIFLSKIKNKIDRDKTVVFSGARSPMAVSMHALDDKSVQNSKWPPYKSYILLFYNK